MKSLLPILLLSAPAFPQAISDHGPHTVGWDDVTFPDPTGGGTLDARLYYPALTEGEGATPDPSAGPFPLVALLHRFIGDPSDYDQLSSQVASWGFLLASIDTQTGGGATMQQEAQDAADMLNWVADESEDLASPYAGMVAAGPWGAIGHSMGGGALFYLIEDEPNVRCLIALQPYRGGALGGFAGSVANLEAFTGSLFIVGGSVDVVAPTATHTLKYFDTAESAARNFHTTVEGLGHQGPTDDPPTNEPLPADEQNELHRRFCAGFLRAELAGEEALYVELLGEGVTAQPVTQESRSVDPPFWVAPSNLLGATMLTGLGASAADAMLIAVSLTTASIPTPAGIFGLDLSAGLVLLVSILPAQGFEEFGTPIPPALSGVTLYFQGFATSLENSAFTAVQATVVP